MRRCESPLLAPSHCPAAVLGAIIITIAPAAGGELTWGPMGGTEAQEPDLESQLEVCDLP